MIKKKINITIKFTPKVNQGFLQAEARVRSVTNYGSRRVGEIAKQAAQETILFAFGARFAIVNDNQLAVPRKLAQARRGERTSQNRQLADRRRGLATLMDKLNDAYASGSEKRIEAAEKNRTAQLAKIRGSAPTFSGGWDKGTQIFDRIARAAKKTPGRNKKVMAILKNPQLMKVNFDGGVISIGIGDIAELSKVRTPSATTEAKKKVNSPFVHMWRQLEFGTGIFAKQQDVPGNVAGRIRGVWWYGPKTEGGNESGIEFIGSKPANIIFQTRSVPYSQDAQEFFKRFNKLLAKALGMGI